MIVRTLSEIDVSEIEWHSYDVIILASGFEARSIHIFSIIPAAQHQRCIVLGFRDAPTLLSRESNDAVFTAAGITPFVNDDPREYENFLRESFYTLAQGIGERPLRVFVDYSVMTRIWYAYILTWLKYSGSVFAADVDFAYSHGSYQGRFENLQLMETSIVPGFEGVSAGCRRTVAVYGLGYDRFATLTVHDIVQPDKFFCFVAHDPSDEATAQRVLTENSEIIEASGRSAILLPLDNLKMVVDELGKLIGDAAETDEIIAVPMGPKTHVLGTLLAGHFSPRLTCWHPLGRRITPVQVDAQGRISCWRIEYRT
jgi:hypothetical protein